MMFQRLVGVALASTCIVLTLIAACQGHATTVKLVRELALRFPPQEVKLSPGQVDQLRALSFIGSSQCLTPSNGGVVVAVEALMGDPVSAQSRALAEARASEVKGWLIRMGVAASAIYDGTTPLGEMVTRKAAASSLTRDEIDSNTVVVELVCDPAK